MKGMFVFRNRQMSIVVLLFVVGIIGISVGLQSGYAHGAGIGTASSGQGDSKVATPSVCGQLGFSNTSYGVGMSPTDLKMGDFNGDGRTDLVTTNFQTDNVSVLLGNGNGTFAISVPYSAPSSPVGIAVADLFGDRVDDLVVADGGGNDVLYLQGAGDGTFYEPYSFGMGSGPYSVLAVDVNNDGFPDLVTASGSSNEVAVRVNDAIGDFGAATHNPVSGNPDSLVSGDFNGDSKVDIATSNHGANSVSVLLGNGNGSFQAPISFGVGTFPFSVATGDFNGDGKADLVSGNRNSSNVSVLFGNGDGLFQNAINLPVTSGPLDVAVGDIDGNGTNDIVTASSYANNVSVVLTNGDGTFRPVQYFNAGMADNAVVVRDLNGDGKTDIATANMNGNNVSVLLNTCATIPNTPTNTPVPTSTPEPTQTPGGPTATPNPACTIQFADVAADNTFYTFVRCLACRGIINGYACGGQGEPCNGGNDPYFRPSNPVTRGQLAKIVSNAAGFSEPVSGQTFEDVVPGSAFYDFVGRLVSREVMGGYACGGAGEPCGAGNLPYFRPGAGATRGQLTKIVSNAAGFSDPAPGTFTFTDIPVGSTFHVYVERLLMNRAGVMGGYDCGGAGEPCDAQSRPYFRPSNALTRGQTSKIVGNAFFPGCVVGR